MIDFDLVLERLQELSSSSTQRLLWTGKMPGEQSSFIEAVCGAFDDGGLARVLESSKRSALYSEELLQSIRKLDIAIKLVKNPSDSKAILDDSALQFVRDAATELIALMQRERLSRDPQASGSSDRR